MCVTQQVTHPVTQEILLTTNWRTTEGKLRSQSAHCANSAKNCTRSALVSRHQQTHHSAWFSKHTTRLRIHSCACLKHSNFLNTDRLRKSGLSNGCSHETLLLFGLQQLSQGRVKQLQNSSDRKTGISAFNLVDYLCFLGSTNSIPIKPGLMSYSRMPSRPYVTHPRTSGRTRTSNPSESTATRC